MFSSPLAGMLRVGIVLLAAGALAGGVYLLAQADDERAASSLEAPTAAASAPRPLSPPADIGAPPAVDTSGWLTYTSPLGFTIKYPPGWMVVIGDIPERAKIFNEKAQEERARRLAVGALEGAKRGEAWIEILPDPYPRFDVDELFQICRPDNLSPSEAGVSEPSEVTFAGLPAVRCVGEIGEAYWVGLPSGRVVGITAYAVDVGDATAGLLQAIMATVSFEAPTAAGAPPAVDTSGWLTYTSPLGFTIKYPPGWVAEDQDPSHGLPLGTARITKQHPDGTGEIVIEGGTVRLPPGLTHAWIEIYPLPFPPQFDADVLVQGCQPDDPAPNAAFTSRQASSVGLAGRSAVRCFTQGLDRTGAHLITVDAYYIDLPSDGVLNMAAYIFDGDDATFKLIQATLSTVSFEAAP